MKKNWMAVLAIICIFLATVLFTIAWLTDRQEKINTAVSLTPLINTIKGVP